MIRLPSLKGKAAATRSRSPLPWGAIGRHAVHGLVLSLMIWGGMLGWQSLHDARLFPVRVVKVDGELHRLAPYQVQAAVNERLQGSSFFGLDLSYLLEGLQALPWVREVRVRREWPDALHLWIEEYEPVALWRGDAVLTADGVLIYPDALDGLVDYPFLSGVDGRELPLWQRFCQLHQQMGQVGLRLKGLREDQRGSLTLVLEDGVMIRVGREDVDSRIQRFLEVYDSALAERANEVSEVDLRYAHGFSVRWKASSSG